MGKSHLGSPINIITDRHDWKHYLPLTPLPISNNSKLEKTRIHMFDKQHASHMTTCFLNVVKIIINSEWRRTRIQTILSVKIVTATKEGCWTKDNNFKIIQFNLFSACLVDITTGKKQYWNTRKTKHFVLCVVLNQIVLQIYITLSLLLMKNICNICLPKSGDRESCPLILMGLTTYSVLVPTSAPVLKGLATWWVVDEQ